MICRKHRLKYNYTCPVCEHASNFIGLDSIYYDSFQAGYKGLQYSSLYIRKTYDEGVEMKKQLNPKKKLNIRRKKMSEEKQSEESKGYKLVDLKVQEARQ